jgi:hypothetical protein
LEGDEEDELDGGGVELAMKSQEVRNGVLKPKKTLPPQYE